MDRGAWLATVHVVAKSGTQMSTRASHSLSLRRRSRETPECTAGGWLQKALLPKEELLPGLPGVPRGAARVWEVDYPSDLLGAEGGSSTEPDASLMSMVETIGRACPGQPPSLLPPPCELFPLTAPDPGPVRLTSRLASSLHAS